MLYHLFFFIKKIVKKFKWREKKFKDKYLRTYFIWGGGGQPKEKEPLTRSTRGVSGPNCSFNQTQPNQDNLSSRQIRKIEGCNPPEEG